MGFAVYEDWAARSLGVERWAGYGVPAFCDLLGCGVAIDRGMGYRCEEIVSYVEAQDGSELETMEEGCGLHFCTDHLDHETHGDEVVPKPDTAEWVAWMLNDESWQKWREENPEKVAALQSQQSSGGEGDGAADSS